MQVANQYSFNLHHLKPEYYNTILYKSGWADLSDYEINVGNNTGQWNEWLSYPLTFQKWNGCNVLSVPNSIGLL